MMPTQQKCMRCGNYFMSSDAIELPTLCPRCKGEKEETDLEKFSKVTDDLITSIYDIFGTITSINEHPVITEKLERYRKWKERLKLE